MPGHPSGSVDMECGAPRRFGSDLKRRVADGLTEIGPHSRAALRAALQNQDNSQLPYGDFVVLGHFWPVHNIPECLEVIGSAVLILQIIRVFPDVASQDRLTLGA